MHHGCCPVRATWGSLPRGRDLLVLLLTRNKEASKELMVLRVRPILILFPTNIIPRRTAHPCFQNQMYAALVGATIVVTVVWV